MEMAHPGPTRPTRCTHPKKIGAALPMAACSGRKLSATHALVARLRKHAIALAGARMRIGADSLTKTVVNGPGPSEKASITHDSAQIISALFSCRASASAPNAPRPSTTPAFP